MSTENKNNPFAFPCEKDEPEKGMTLRDYFANSAMQGLISKRCTSHQDNEMNPRETFCIAKHSYDIADAMLKQREI